MKRRQADIYTTNTQLICGFVKILEERNLTPL